MREIKFRARWKDTNKLVTDFEDFCVCSMINDMRWTVSQYTGFKDWIGKEIYEGDILIATKKFIKE